MGKKIDETQYWLRRHEVKSKTLASVGQKSYSDRANCYMYKQVLERYNIILDQLNFPQQMIKVLDAGGGRGIFLDLFLKRKYKISLVDISPIAIEDVKARYSTIINATVCDLIELPQNQEYDIIHCFDVLYHILDDVKWAKVLENFSRVANKYIILHERFLRRKPFILSKHIRFRPYRTTTKKLHTLGFKEVKSIPTHFWVGRLLTYRLSGFAPQFFYQLDKLTLSFLDKMGSNWGSYHIKVFERA